MGLQISDLNKKLIICSLGIIILTYGICLLYKKQIVTEKFGPAGSIPGERIPEIIFANYSSVIPAVLESEGVLADLIMGTTVEQDVEAATNQALSISQRAINFAKSQLTATEKSAKTTGDIKKSEMSSKMNVSAKAEKTNAKIEAKALAAKVQAKAIATAQSVKDTARSLMQKFSYFRMFAMIGILYEWGLPFVQCGWYWFTNIKQCFFWYFLDIIGQILYLPFGIILWLFPILQPPSDLFWNTLDDIDCLCFDITGFHFLHYSPTIIKNCYSCSPTEFPSFDVSDLFQVI